MENQSVLAMKNLQKLVLFSLFLQNFQISAVIGIRWDHSVNINDDYRLLWNVLEKTEEIMFEVQVRTHGYVGLGFSLDGNPRSGADMTIGWIDQSKTYFQDRHIKKNGDGGEPFVDPSQDYVLLLGYENATHTVMRFKRKLDTCDTSHDIPITNDTMRIMYVYHPNEPKHGSVIPGSLPNSHLTKKGYIPLALTQRPPTNRDDEQLLFNSDIIVDSLQIRNQDVEVPMGGDDDAKYWCKVFEMPNLMQKQHLIKYEPVFDSSKSKDYLQHIILYECQGNSPKLAALARESGRICNNRNNPQIPCNAIVAFWTKGSEGFTYPSEAGYPLDSSRDRFYLMETYYSNQSPTETIDLSSWHTNPVVDSSGLKIYYTQSLRKYDAGVLSIGMDPNWRHIIPPGHEKVISEGHCIDDCTKKSFPPQGISIFAVIMQTHNIGKEVKLRQIRKHEELLPISYDGNVHAGYAEFREVSPVKRVLPGDSLIAECTYNSSDRTTITLGGMTARQEACNIFAVYYPRQKALSTCQSVPSLPTVLHSLGIEELAMDSSPVLISAPPSLAGMTLESRLIGYDWRTQFDAFQQITRSGSFRAICVDAKNIVVPGTDTKEHFSRELQRFWNTPVPNTCSYQQQYHHHHPSSSSSDDSLMPAPHDSNDIYVTEMAVRRKKYDNSDVESMSLSGSQRQISTIKNQSSIVMFTILLLLKMIINSGYIIT